MSRIGFKQIEVPAGVEIQIGADNVTLKGSKGALETPLFPGITVENVENFLKVKRDADSKDKKAKHGLVRALLANSVKGVSVGFQKVLLLQGVGYRAQKKGNDIQLSLGFSHEVLHKIPEGINVDIPEPTKIIVSGIDKQKVGELSAQIRKYRPPEPYKGKGVRYEDEHVRRKAGKSGSK
ncbi:MAG: 50S ribosomal protein L6 [Spirochaetia bacterium]|nr:50S ribosomal protein L6 [Spirochaetia bacterium]